MVVPDLIVAYRDKEPAIAGQKKNCLACVGLHPGRLSEQHDRTAKMGAIDDGFEALLEPFYNGKKLTDPISTKEDKYQLLPAFLKVKGESKARALHREDGRDATTGLSRGILSH